MKVGNAVYELRIRAGGPWWRIDWGGLWRYRDLLFLLVRRDFLSKYSQTILGPLWFLVQPLVTTALFTVVFAGVAKVPTDGAPPLLFYLSGLLPWNYFSGVFSATSVTLVANAGLFGKVYFPRLIVPIAVAMSNVFALIIQLLLVLSIYAWLRLGGDRRIPDLGFSVLLIPLLVLQVGALAVGAGLWISAVTVKFRDFTHASGLILNLWFYATPIIVPLSIIPTGFRYAVALNPLTFPAETFRYIFLGGVFVDTEIAATSILMTVALFISGVLAFQRCERTFIDTV